jgi:hypothetical protein
VAEYPRRGCRRALLARLFRRTLYGYPIGNYELFGVTTDKDGTVLITVLEGYELIEFVPLNHVWGGHPVNCLTELFITKAPDGNLWFDCTAPGSASYVARFTFPSENVDYFPAFHQTFDLVARGADIWFTSTDGPKYYLERLTPSTGKVTTYKPPSKAELRYLSLGKDNELWATDLKGNFIWHICVDGKNKCAH